MKKILLCLFIVFTAVSMLYPQQGGYALKFDGTDDYVSVSDNTSLDFTEFTVEMWVYKTNSGDIKLIGQANPNDANKGWSLGITSGNTVFAETINAGGQSTQIKNGTFPANKWTHLAMTWKYNDKLILYINGKKIEEKASGAWDITTTSLLIIGKAPWYNLNENHFGGYMDEIRLWNTVRTEAEINANMYKELAGNETGLVAYYKMSNGSGTTLTDNQTSGTNNGTINGAAWKTSSAFAGPRQSLDFDGSDDYISIPYDNSLDFTEFTVEMWVYHTKSASDQKIIGNANSADPRRGFCLGISDGEKLYPEVFNDGSTNVVSSEAIPLNEWVHIAMTWKKGNYSDGIKGFINGKQVISTSTVNTDMNNSNGWTIGAAPWFPEKYFQGKIDEVRIWNTVRTEAQIRENMMKPLAGNETGLISYYRLDQLDGTTLYGITSNPNNGTLNNMDAATDWVSSGAFNTWIGTESPDWSTAANWSSGSAPLTTDNVGLYKWDLGNDATISGTPTVNNLLFSSTAGPVLSSDFTVNKNLLLEKNLDLNGRTITLGSSGYLSEGNFRLYGTGSTITTTRNLSNISAENVGGLGAVITIAADMGATTVTRGHSEQIAGSTKSILRYYDISPTTNSGLNAALEFNYNDDEFNGINENNFVLFKSGDGGTTWTNTGGTLDASNNKITLSGIDNFSRWTVGDKTTPLPVELTSFTANYANDKVTLNWQTATEVNNYGFQVERAVVNSELGVMNYEIIGFVAGSGNSNSVRDYYFTDNTANAGKYSYRLKQIDNDGSFIYSNEITVETGHAPSLRAEYALYQNCPNPFNPSTIISYQLPENEHVTLKIYDLLGRETATLVNENQEAGVYSRTFNASSLTSGLYIALFKAGNCTKSIKMNLIK